MECIFCKIVKGEIPNFTVFEDEKFLSFLDVKPINPGHVLLITKKHTEYLFDLQGKEYSDLLLKAKEIAKRLKTTLNPKKVGMAVDGFGVPHVHIHLIPINGVGELNPERATTADFEELKNLARKLKI